MPMFYHPSKLAFYALMLCLCCLTFPTIAQIKAGKPLAEYNSIIVEVVTIDKNPKLSKFPAGHDSDLQKSIVADLRKKNVFAEVIDGTRQSGEPEPPAAIPAGGQATETLDHDHRFQPGQQGAALHDQLE
jgi:hypothetical protein